MGIVRLLLALSVYFAHAGAFPLTGKGFVGGSAAVQSFFIISGFYMALVLSDGYEKKSSFYFNRFLRIYPTYWIVLFGLTASQLALGDDCFVQAILNSDVLNSNGKLFMMFSNIFVFGSDIMMFLFPDGDGMHFTAFYRADKVALWKEYHSIPPAWSLPLEMAFYAIAPFIVKRRLILVLLLIVSLFLRYAVYTLIADKDPWTYRFLPLELAFFCAGALAFQAYRLVQNSNISRYAGILLSIAAFAYIVFFNWVPAIIPDSSIFSGAKEQLYLFLLISVPFIFAASRKNKFDRWAGELSYPIYISHWPVLMSREYLPETFANPVYNVLFYVFIISLSINLLVQWPVEKFFKRASAGPLRTGPEQTADAARKCGEFGPEAAVPAWAEEPALPR